MLIWICGPSGAGKTTLGRALYNYFKPTTPNLFLLDGDDFRAAMGNDLGYSAEDRLKNGRRIARLCRLLESQGIDVICCGATIHPEVQSYNRKMFRQYWEIVMEVSYETLLRRDFKRIHSRARDGKLLDVIAVDIKWAPPATPDLILNNDEDRTSFDGLVRAAVMCINGVTDNVRPSVDGA